MSEFAYFVEHRLNKSLQYALNPYCGIIVAMKDIHPYITNDGSVGLYSPEFDDIYHSTFGAYAEACEKFIIPADLDFYIENYNQINVLDICYGIGYNSKSFINFYLKKISEKSFGQNTRVGAIYSDNILSEIDSQAERPSVYINAIDTDKKLVFLSPFFTTSAKRLPKCQNLPTDKVKYLSSGKIEKLYDYDESVNFIIIDNLMKKLPEFAENNKWSNYLNMPQNRVFFDKNSITYYKYKMPNRQIARPIRLLGDLLHNIYYHHVSRRYKRALKAAKNANIAIDFNINDARQVIINDNKIYQLIFLDAFTPTKCPCLWTLDFFMLLYKHLDDNGRILTYSNSAQVRNAFLQAGFFVGKIFNERTKTFTGTIATKNKNLIKHDLSEYDLSLIKTRAGIFYRDKNLTGLNEAIIEAHKKEVEESPLISSSKFIKQYRKGQNNV